jgi:soluble lytic murein transglycosylase-like protein
MPLAPRWAGQDTYDAAFYAAARRCPQLTVPLLKGVTAHESGFNPRAFNPSDPPTGAYGLMQMIEPTARALGYSGAMTGLYDPTRAVQLGADLLCENLARSGVVADSLSAYNGGWRNVFGFGSVLPSGQYGNQAYVDSVLEKVRYFESWERQKAGATPGALPVVIAGGAVLAAVLASRSGGRQLRRWSSARRAGR